MRTHIHLSFPGIVCCLLSCGGAAQEVTSVPPDPVAQIEAMLEPATEPLPVRFTRDPAAEVALGDFRVVQPGYTPLSATEIEDRGLSEFATMDLSAQGMCVAESALHFLQSTGRMPDSWYSGIIADACGATTYGTVITQLPGGPQVEVAGAGAETVEDEELYVDENGAAYRVEQTEEGSARMYRVGRGTGAGSIGAIGALSGSSHAFCASPGNGSELDTGPNEVRRRDTCFGTRAYSADVRGTPTVSLSDEYSFASPPENLLWWTPSQMEALGAEGREQWFSRSAGYVTHTGIACGEVPERGSRCVAAWLEMPTRLLLDPVRPTGVSPDTGYWLHGWSAETILTATVAGRGLGDGYCRVRQLDETGEFFLGCPSAPAGGQATLTITFPTVTGLRAQSELQLRVPNGASTVSPQSLSLPAAPEAIETDRFTMGRTVAGQVANVLATERTRSGFARPEILNAQMDVMERWAPLIERYLFSLNGGDGESIGVTLTDAMREGQAVPWPIGVTRFGAIRMEMYNPAHGATQFVNAFVSSSLYSPWVDGIAVAVVPGTTERRESIVLVVFYERVEDPAAAALEMEALWHDTRSALGLEPATPVRTEQQAQLQEFVDTVSGGGDADTAWDIFYEQRSNDCYFYEYFSRGVFQERSMLIRDRMSVRIVYEPVPGTNRYWAHLVGIADGACPQR